MAGRWAVLLPSSALLLSIVCSCNCKYSLWLFLPWYMHVRTHSCDEVLCGMYFYNLSFLFCVRKKVNMFLYNFSQI
jgi:hypothetical protein